jgi:hypothetical protein
VCELYGWTFGEYMSQPVWFTDLAVQKLEVKRKREEAQANKDKGKTARRM